MKKLGFSKILLFISLFAFIVSMSIPAFAFDSDVFDVKDFDDDWDSILEFELPIDYYFRVIYATHFEDGIIAILTDNEVAYFENGEVVSVWEHDTSDYDFFFVVGDAYPDAQYDLCAKLYNGIVSFRDKNTMSPEIDNVYYYDTRGQDIYVLSLDDYGMLWLWSPYIDVKISSSVTWCNIYQGYVFFDDQYGAHAMGVSAYEAGRRNREYYDYHPLPIIDLNDIYGAGANEYYDDFIVNLYEGDDISACFSDFCNRHNASSSNWGNPKMDFRVDDFASPISQDVVSILDTYDVPSYHQSDAVQYENIDFYGRNGYLCFFMDYDSNINCISWTSYGGSAEMFDALNEVVAACGPFVRTETYENGSKTENLYDVGGQIIHVGREDRNGVSVVYVLAYYDSNK